MSKNIIKKKDLTKKTSKKQDLEELVDEKGGKISGDEHIDQSGMATTTKDTTDDHVRKSRQGSPFFRRYYSESEDITLDEVAKNKMKKVVEDILTKKKFDKDVIDKVRLSDGIPTMDMVKETHPVLVRRVSNIKSLIDRDDVSGTEKAILLNELLSIDLSEIPTEYKRELGRKLGV
tara:strand:+ start:1575 stop:2102 length:528 start_codon:yes stop_codon:yes gene_type:complete